MKLNKSGLIVMGAVGTALGTLFTDIWMVRIGFIFMVIGACIEIRKEVRKNGINRGSKKTN